jgi:hypothetical protein
MGTLEISCYIDRYDVEIDVTVSAYRIISPLDESYAWDRIYGRIRPGVVLRIDQFIPPEHPDNYIDSTWEQRDGSLRHGGDAGQEIAALLSLILGTRMKSGGITRVHDPSGTEPQGLPVDSGPPPYLPPAPINRMLPYLTDGGRAVDYSRLSLLDSYAVLSRKQALALVRAARSYQEAIWVAETDPRQAWLRLVTAVEIVAQLTTSPEPPLARLRRVHPDIAEWVAKTDDAELIDRVTELLVDQQRITGKFLDFFETFKPMRPRRRPHHGRLNWNDLQAHLRTIYRARSKDLHEGIPIPAAMCEPQFTGFDNRVPPEMTYVSISSQELSTINLQMFEYLVHNSLLNWWSFAASASNAD